MLKIKEFIHKYKYQIVIYTIFCIGFLARLLLITKYPSGLNQDEASAGYDAWAILKYGIDRHGKSFPVHFISWGSGQNVLYSYLMIPFIILFGLNQISVRLPMAIVGCISLVVVYKMFEKYNKKIAIIAIVFFTICPWHIMKSRWGLESNLFPDMVLWGVYFIIKALKDNKISIFYIGITILSLSVYSYGTAYLFLPIFILGILIYLLIIKEIKIKDFFISIAIAGIIALPMMLFVIINTFDLNEIKIGLITIPRVYENRFQQVTIFSKGFYKLIIKNFIDNAKIIIFQTDGLNYNSIPFYGIYYVFSLPFMILGIIESYTKRSTEKSILNIWNLTSLILLLIMQDSNINRLNIITIPLIIYSIIGMYNITKDNKKTLIILLIIYTIAFAGFELKYIKTQGKSGSTFTKGLEEPIKYVSSLDVEHIYISNHIVEPYIYTLFYTQTQPKDFIDTVEYETSNVAFEKIKGFGKYRFYIPESVEEKNVVYIVTNKYKYDKSKFDVKEFENYTVLKPIL